MENRLLLTCFNLGSSLDCDTFSKALESITPGGDLKEGCFTIVDNEFKISQGTTVIFITLPTGDP